MSRQQHQQRCKPHEPHPTLRSFHVKPKNLALRASSRASGFALRAHYRLHHKACVAAGCFEPIAEPVNVAQRQQRSLFRLYCHFSPQRHGVNDLDRERIAALHTRNSGSHVFCNADFCKPLAIHDVKENRRFRVFPLSKRDRICGGFWPLLWRHRPWTGHQRHGLLLRPSRSPRGCGRLWRGLRRTPLGGPRKPAEGRGRYHPSGPLRQTPLAASPHAGKRHVRSVPPKPPGSRPPRP